MFLKVEYNSRLIHFLFKGKETEIKPFIESRLFKNFERTEKNFYKISSPSQIKLLNDILEEFKLTYKYYLNHTLPPFTFFIFKTRDFSESLPLYRSGKIYFEKALQKEIEDAAKGWGIFYKIQSWFNGLELVLPATVDPKLIFPFKDIFWCGKHNHCFFCNSTFHSFQSCPALTTLDPVEEFYKVFDQTFKEIADRIKRSIAFNFKETEPNPFFIRFFFFHPAFLRYVLFKGREIKLWGNFNPQEKPPVRGGDLGLGLDFLLKKDLSKAEKSFKSAESSEVLASLGLFFVNVFKKELDQAIYYTENVIEKEKTPFIKSYAFLLKGRIYEIKGDILSAQENYKEAVRIDGSCFPANYLNALITYRDEDDLSLIKRFMEKEEVIFWSFLDPYLLKVQKDIEDYIFKKIEEKREIGLQRLKEAENKFHEIKPILSESRIKEFEEKLKELYNDIVNGGLGTLERASKQALELGLEFQSILARNLKEVRENLHYVKREYEKLRYFWNKYPYKRDDPEFGKTLKEVGEIIVSLEKKLSAKNSTKMIKIMVKESETAVKKIAELKNLQEELKKKWIFRKKLYHFLTTFSVIEGILLAFYIIVNVFSVFSTMQPLFGIESFIIVSFIIMIFCIVNAWNKNV